MPCENDAEPVLLEIKNRTLGTAGGRERGIQIGIGTPQQGLLSTVYFTGNETNIGDPDCGTYPLARCASIRGGLYYSNQSTTFQQQIEAQWNGTDPVYTESFTDSTSAVVLFHDTLSYDGSGSMEQFPMRLVLEPARQHEIGLGANSTFLAHTMSAGRFPSRVVGFNYGSVSPNRPRNGDVVFGGYNNAVIEKDSLTTFDLVGKYGPALTVKTMTLETDNGTSIVLNQDPFTVSLRWPRYEYMHVPQSVFDDLPAKLGLNGSTSSGSAYFAQDGIVKGDLVVEFENFTTTIPAHELFSRPSYRANDGAVVLNNTADEVLRFSETTSSMLHWGAPFMSQHYMIVDWERNQMQIARIAEDVVNRVATVEPEIKVVCGLNDEASAGASGDVAASSTGAGESSTAGSSSNTGAIVGGVVGGVALIALVAFIFFFGRRRGWFGRNKGDQEHDPFLDEAKHSLSSYQGGRQAHPSPQEMALTHVSEMDSATSPPKSAQISSPSELVGQPASSTHQTTSTVASSSQKAQWSRNRVPLEMDAGPLPMVMERDVRYG